MKAGALKHVIRLQRSTTALNEAGTPAATWSDLATLRAEVVSLSTAEYIRQLGAADETTLIFRTRYLAGVTNADRVLFAGRTYNLREVHVIGRNRGLELRAMALDEGAS